MLYQKGLFELSQLLNKGEIKSVEIAESLMDRMTQRDGEINSFITRCGENLLEAAKQSDQRRISGNSLSPFDGIPVAIKDNINTEGVKTTCASKMLSNFTPPFSATVWEKLRAAGFILSGKTNMDEFAMGSSSENSFFGATLNPHDTSRVPGGSSGGSAAAVADFMSPIALGSDTGGSIRQPAAFCGVTGIKPTYGRVSRYGMVAFASSLDQIGTFGRTVNDVSKSLEIIAGHDKRDSTSVPREVDFQTENLTGEIKGVKVGVPKEYFTGISEEIKTAVQSKIKELEDGGAEIIPIKLKYTEYAIPIYYLIATAEASSNLARYDGVRYGYRSEKTKDLASLYTASRSEGFGKEVKRRIMLGTYALSSGYYDAYYLQALKGRTLIIEDFKQAFAQVDAIVTSTTTTTAFKLGEMVNDPLQMYMSDILTISANLAGIPAMSLPIGRDSKKLPMGLQIMGNHFEEEKILNIAKFIEQNCEEIASSS